jgi:hypothetical protein
MGLKSAKESDFLLNLAARIAKESVLMHVLFLTQEFSHSLGRKRAAVTIARSVDFVCFRGHSDQP